MTALRLLLDQMIDADVAGGLRAVGHDVCTVSELGMARADDAEILEVAIRQRRVLVTLDDDFGDWAVLPLAHHSGVLRIKADPTTTEMIESILVSFLRVHAGRQFSDRLVIVSSTGVRWIQTAAERPTDTE
jgi:predicted nuclease of predicted toxin-antitoxin system